MGGSEGRGWMGARTGVDGWVGARTGDGWE